jgi:hypothetical protein
LAAVLAVAAPAAAQIEVRPLAVIDAFSTGAGGPGLGADLWQGASTPLVRQVMPTLGDRPMSPAAAMLARHVLTTGATAPEGAGSDTDLAGQRLLALIDLGGARAVDAIVRTAPSLADSAPLAQAGAESSLILHHEDRACSIAEALKVGRDGVYWLELRAFCQAMAGDADAAQTTFSLANEAAKDPVFRRLMAAKLIGAGAPPAGVKTPPLTASLRDGLDLALTRALQLDPASALDGASPAVAAALAGDTTLPAETRNAAAARAMRGAMTLDDLSEHGDLPADAAATAVAAANQADAAASFAATVRQLGAKPGVLAEARLASLAAGQSDPVAAGQALEALLARAKTPSDFIVLSRLAKPGLRTLVSADKTLTAPLLFARAAAAAGDVEIAKALRARITADNTNASDLAILDAVIAALAGTPDAPTLDRLAERGGHDGAKSAAQAGAVLFMALGDTLSADARAEVAGFDVGKTSASAAKLALLEIAAGAKAKGEAALLALSLAADAPPAGLAPADRSRVVRALRQAGLDADARAIDAEGLLWLK